MTSSSGHRVLVVEDDPVFARTLMRRLESQGHEVHVAKDGREGMKAIVSLEPHLVISDWMMPHVDGLELCRSVKTGLGDAAPYFVLLTSLDDINARVLALETGADDFLVKPCHEGELAARVRSGLRQVVLRAEIRRLNAELELLRGTVLPLAAAAVAPAVLARCGCGRLYTGGNWTDPASLPSLACPECGAKRHNGHDGPKTRAA